MTRFWKRRRETFDLETMLRANRPEPSREFAAGLADRVRAHGTQPRGFVRTRVAFALGVSLVLLAALASVGGLGYGAASGQRAATALGNIVLMRHDGPTPASHGPSHNQYKTTICHKTNRSPKSGKSQYQEITVSNNALPAHQAHGDIIPAPPGGCPP